MRFFLVGLTLAVSIAAAQDTTWRPVAPRPNTIAGHYRAATQSPTQGGQLQPLSQLRPRTYVQPDDKVFPHLALGGGWETILVIVNMSDTSVNFAQDFYDQSGNPMNVTFRSIPDGVLTTTSAVEGTLPSGGSFNILLSGGSALQVGWSILSYESTYSRIGGYAIFRGVDRGPEGTDFEALVPLSGSDDYIFFFPFDNLQNFVTSMALLNPATDLPARVTLTFLNTSGVSIGRDSFTLNPGQQIAFEVPSRYPITQNKVGSILVESDTDCLSGLGFRFNPGGAFATIPIMNWSGLFSYGFNR